MFSTGEYQRVLVLMKQRRATVLFSWRAYCLDWELLSLIGTIIHLSHTSWVTHTYSVIVTAACDVCGSGHNCHIVNPRRTYVSVCLDWGLLSLIGIYYHSPQHRTSWFTHTVIVVINPRRACASPVYLRPSVCVSVTTLAASASVYIRKQLYTRVSLRLFLDFDSWIFEKKISSKVIV